MPKLYRENLRFLFFLVFSTLFLPGCNNKSHKKLYTIGFSQCTLANKWRQTMLDEMQRELNFYPELNFIVKDANGDTKQQNNHIKKLTDAGVDLLIVSPNEADPITPAVESAIQAGIPVVVVDRKTASNQYTAYVGASNYEVGNEVAQFAQAILKGKGNLLEISDIPGSSADMERHTGFIDQVKKSPALFFAGKIYLEGDVNPSGENLRTYLQQHNNIHFIFAQNDRLALSAAKVCNDMNLEKNITIVGVDGLLGPNGGIDLVEKSKLKATVLYPTGGKEAIELAINILYQKPYKKENILMSTVIDSSNVRMVKMQDQRLIAQQMDIDRRQKKIEEQIAIADNQANIIIVVSFSLALSLIFAGINLYYLRENKKINKTLEARNTEIAEQRNQLADMFKKVKEANDFKFNFFTNISHELRTPLTLIIGPVEDSLCYPKVPPAIKNNLAFVHKNSLRLLRLINQLMDFRKIEEGKMTLKASQYNIAAFVAETAASFKEVAKKKSIDFNITNTIGDDHIWFEANLLDKVLFNILSNAFKFTRVNGSINVTIGKDKNDQNVLISITDTGIGMTPDELHHAFDLFYQGHSENYTGTGLGLTLSNELIKLHHGKLMIESNKQKGTSFTISLPKGNHHLLAAEMLPDKPEPTNTYEDIKIYESSLEAVVINDASVLHIDKEFSVLIIEDNEDLGNFLHARLGTVYDVYVAANGNAGLEMAFDILPDLIIADIIMPGKTGMEITGILKKDIRTFHIPIILLTAKKTLQEQIAGIKLRADAFIIKPFNLEYLDETIKNLLYNRALLREHYTSELPQESRTNLSSKADRKFLNEFNNIIEKNIANDKFSVDDIGRAMGVSRVQLYRKVKSIIGHNINDYILATRLQKSKYFLVHEDFTISEIAFKVGFATQSYFSTVFKNKFLVTPSEYRESKKRTRIL